MIANASYQMKTWTSSGIERAISMNQPTSRRSQPVREFSAIAKATPRTVAIDIATGVRTIV